MRSCRRVGIGPARCACAASCGQGTVTRDSGVAVLLITTDLNEVAALSDRCFVIYRGRLAETPLDREAIGLAMGGAGSRAERASAR